MLDRFKLLKFVVELKLSEVRFQEIGAFHFSNELHWIPLTQGKDSKKAAHSKKVLLVTNFLCWLVRVSIVIEMAGPENFGTSIWQFYDRFQSLV